MLISSDKKDFCDFIFYQHISNPSLCDSIIDFHKNSTNKTEGQVLGGVDKRIKDSIDVALEGNLLSLYLQELQVVCDSYSEKFIFCNHYSPWRVIDAVNIQHYKPSGGFKVWHCERTNPEFLCATRHLVFMTYLNDVNDGGETEWFYQKVKVKPKKGLTVIWPCDWTHTHRGLVSETQDKYIVTGWFNYTER